MVVSWDLHPRISVVSIFWGGAQAGRAKVNIEFVVMQMPS